MVEDRITDGERIGELLASELTGPETAPLDRLAVVDADADATSSDAGTLAYRIALDGERIGAVRLYPGAVRIELTKVDGGPPDDADDGTATARDDLNLIATGDGATIEVRSGAAVKRARDLIAELATR